MASGACWLDTTGVHEHGQRGGDEDPRCSLGALTSPFLLGSNFSFCEEL